MKHIRLLRISLAFIFSILFLSIISCEKVIELPLKEMGPLLVIEGNIDNQNTQHEVLLSRSTSFSFGGTRIPVSGALVEIQEGGKLPVILREEEDGRYVLKNMRGKPGLTYRLRVSLQGKEYESFSTMPQPVLLDSVGIVETYLFSETIKTPAVLYEDPADVKNYYHFKMKVNQVQNNSFWVFNDHFTNGKLVTQSLNDFSRKLDLGDTVMIEMRCIDSAMYTYWKVLDNQNLSAATPSNPESNISNGSLGYFSAHTVTSGSFEVR